MTGARVGLTAFRVTSGILFGLAVILAAVRTVIRVRHFRRLYIDDGFLFLAVAALTAGTGLMLVDIPYAYLQEQVEAGVEAPPPNLMDSLLQDQKVQNAATVLIATTIFSVKFSFLFFFRLLLQRTKKWYIWWWWTIFIILIPSAALFMFSDFISCPYTGEAVLTECVTPAALKRENAAFVLSVVLDTVTDGLLISIPVILLWSVHINLRRKLALGGIMCLGIFMILCSIIRISVSNIIDGQVDTTWVLLWTEIEACVAVIVVSITAFRTLFTSNRSIKSPTENQCLNKETTHRGLPGSTISMPSYPSRDLQGLTMLRHPERSHNAPDWGRPRPMLRAESGDSTSEMFPICGAGILVTQNFSVELEGHNTAASVKPSHESLV